MTDTSAATMAASGSVPFDATPVMTYHRILTALRLEIEQYDKDVWNPRTSMKRIRAMQAERERLLRDISIIEALGSQHGGFDRPVKEDRSPKLNRPKSAYGEP